MKIKRILLFLCAALIPVILPAQDNARVDSLEALLENVGGEEHFRMLIQLSVNTLLDQDDRLDYARDAVDYARDLDQIEYISEAYINLGNTYHNRNEDQEAIRAYERANDASQEENYEEGMALALGRIGRIHMFQQDQVTALDYLNQAREHAGEIKNTGIEATIVYWIGEVYRRVSNDFEKARSYYDEALPLAREAGDRKLEADILSNIGVLYYSQGDFNGAFEFYEQAAPLYRTVGEKFSEGRIYILLANANLNLGNYDVALAYYQQALPIFEEINSRQGIGAVYSGMAVSYFHQEFYEKALEIHFKKLELSREIGDEMEIGNSLNNIGVTYSQMAADSLQKMFGIDYQESPRIEPSDIYLDYFRDALDYYNQALEVREKIDHRAGIAGTVYNIGIAYINAGKPDQALEYLQRALRLNQELNDQSAQADIYLRLGQVYLAYENLPEATRYLQQSLKIALELDIKQTLEYIYLNLSELNIKLNNYEMALKYYRDYSAVRDTLTREQRMKDISEMQVKYETEATAKENALLQAESRLADTKLRQTRIILTITIIAIGIFLVMVVQLIRQNNLKKKANRELERSNTLITEQKKEITDSIQYASRIQNAMLPPGDYVDKLLPERFIIYMPRDIVSGDYYYITEKEGRIICVAADCTGHGVPGAFMSMLGIAFLNEIISKQTELHTDEMLEELRSHVIKSLHQTGKEGESQDGMDLALYIADLDKMTIEFSGANNSLLICRNGDMIEARADKMPIGIHTRAKEPFTRHNLDLKEGDMIYTYSDGYPDQFGGPDHKKFMIKKFKKMLREINRKSMEEQKKIMEQTLQDWMADTEQVDDILVIGVRV